MSPIATSPGTAGVASARATIGTALDGAADQ